MLVLVFMNSDSLGAHAYRVYFGNLSSRILLIVEGKLIPRFVDLKVSVVETEHGAQVVQGLAPMGPKVT